MNIISEILLAPLIILLLRTKLEKVLHCPCAIYGILAVIIKRTTPKEIKKRYHLYEVVGNFVLRGLGQ